ncbi:MAG: thiamine biosynthesis protein ThiJ [Gemmatimonas sp.]|nr:thiamine biosynthesis protein ThiJ [Gemmatimonas sp.]
MDRHLCDSTYVQQEYRMGPSFALLGLMTLAGASLRSGPLTAHASAVPPGGPQPATGHVLVVVSSAGRDSGRTRPGFEMDEFSQTWHILTANGLRVTVASPAGGAPQPDAFSAKRDYNARLLADTAAMRQLRNTRRTAGLRAEDFAAVFIVGGKGAMFDLPTDTALVRLVGQIHDRGGVVGAVCHGPAALASVRLSNGQRLVAGKRVTGFTDEEEVVFGKKWRSEYPWLLEAQLRSVGGKWEESGLMLPHVVRDDRLVTGQNPYATAATVETLITAMGRPLAARTPWRDERSVRFAADALTRDPLVVRQQLAKERSEIEVEMIGLIGYYQLQATTDSTRVREALTLLELAAPYMPQPEISLGMADAFLRLGRVREANALARHVAAEHPDRADVKTLLTQLEGRSR